VNVFLFPGTHARTSCWPVCALALPYEELDNTQEQREREQQSDSATLWNGDIFQFHWIKIVSFIKISSIQF